MGMELRDLIERVREHTDILEVVGRHVPLDSHNKGLCPFHKEQNPSFSVNPTGQYFHCFGCGAAGDVFGFLELYEGRPFLEVLSELAQEAGIPYSPLSADDRDRITESRTLEEILGETARFYHLRLTADARRYLIEQRGITEETVNRFLVGYASGGLRKRLVDECHFSMDLCLKAGVLKERGQGGVGDYFRQRIVFPNLRRGRVVHLTGRTFDGREPKYLHLPGGIRYLYNEDALYNKEACLTEGALDCLSLVQIGYPAVAVLGASNFKPEWEAKFSRCEKVYLCLDGDEAGRQGALKIGRLLGERARIVQLPDGCDVNDYLRGHANADFDGLVASTQDVIKYQLSLVPQDTDRTQLPGLLESVVKQLADMDRARTEAYLRYEIKPRFGLKKEDVDAYRALVNRHRKEKSEAPAVLSPNPDAEAVYTALFDGLVDLVEQDGEPAFLVKEESKLSVLARLERNGTLYLPPAKEQIPWLLPRAEQVLAWCEPQGGLSRQESDQVLYEDLLAYHKGVSELPSEECYDLIAAWDLHTYLLEAVQYSPIICLFAVPERGKSRTGKGMIHVAYRGIHVESLRDAYLVRVANDLQASLFFDVKDIWRKAEKQGTEDILLHRFEKGAKVPRVLYPDRGAHRDIVYYSMFGPTVIGTNEGVHRILETRAVPINMPETSRRFENDVTPELALPLKERLVAFRARHLGESLPDIPKPASGRLGDILKPLQQMILLVAPDREEQFLGLVKELEGGRRVDNADSLEAEILVTLVGLKDMVERGVLPIKKITDTLNEDRPERSRLTYQRLGRRLSAMGFKKARAVGGAAIVWDEGSVERMMGTYGLRETYETYETHETHVPGG